MIQYLPTAMERAQSLAEMHRVSRQGGRLVVIVYRLGRAVQGKQADVLSNGLFRYAFLPDELYAALNDAGFQHVHVGGMVNAARLARLGRLGMWIDLAFGKLKISGQFGMYLYGMAVR